MQELKEVIKSKFDSKSQRLIALMLKVSRNNVSRIYKEADETRCDWEKVKFLDSQEIGDFLFQDHPLVSQTMHVNHKPGDEIMVDWASST